MVVVMQEGATEEQIQGVINNLMEMGFDIHRSTGVAQTVLGAVGANPAEVPSGPEKGRRTLAAEQDLGRALARSLSDPQRARGVIEAQSLGDIVSGPGRADSLAAPAGLALSDMTGEQRTQALRLIEEYARNMRGELAEQELARMRQAGPELIRFAWAGPLEPGKPHYYRLHGPTLLIEYDNTQNDANHCHSVLRDPADDFGDDLLRRHIAEHHETVERR